MIENNLAVIRRAIIMYIKQVDRIKTALRENVREHKIEEAFLGDWAYYEREKKKKW